MTAAERLGLQRRRSNRSGKLVGQKRQPFTGIVDGYSLLIERSPRIVDGYSLLIERSPRLPVRSLSSIDMACWSMLENANEIPQKLVEPVPPCARRPRRRCWSQTWPASPP